MTLLPGVGARSLEHGRLTRRQLFQATILPLVGAVLGGCTRQEDPLSPPSIRYGEDVCAACNMIISDPAYASAYRTTDGDVRLFDDLGEMVVYLRTRQEPTVATFVHHYETQGWLMAEDAAYVRSGALKTPMGFGVAATSSPEEAWSLAERLDGRTYTFQALLQTLEPPAPRGHGR
jgi:copper chaperone NosL